MCLTTSMHCHSLRVCHCLVAAVLPSHHHPLRSRRPTSSALWRLYPTLSARVPLLGSRRSSVPPSSVAFPAADKQCLCFAHDNCIARASRHKRRSQPPHHCLAIIRRVPTGRPAVLSGVFTLLSLRVCHCLVAAVLPSHHHPLHSRRRTSSVCASAHNCIGLPPGTKGIENRHAPASPLPAASPPADQQCYLASLPYSLCTCATAW